MAAKKNHPAYESRAKERVNVLCWYKYYVLAAAYIVMAEFNMGLMRAAE